MFVPTASVMLINKKASGFTLIELIVVIAILGILSATALPKFIDLSSNARESNVKAAEGAYRSANALIYSEAYLQDKHTSSTDTSIDYNGVNVTTRYGYLAYNPNMGLAFQELEAVLNIAGSWSFTFEPGGASGVGAKRIRLSPEGANDVTNMTNITDISRCYFEYTPASASAAPQYITDISNCD